jgi:ABC-type uncharacterized transport system involved in gliding motility auxiliary subunit
VKAGLLILPFLAILIAAVGTAVGSAFPETKWIAQAAWGLGAAVVALWVMLDLDSWKALFARKGAKYGASSGLVVALGVAVIVGLAVVAHLPRFNKSVDVTRDRLNTLSDQSAKVIDQIKQSGEPVKVTAFMTDEKVSTEFRDMMTLYQSKGANFAIEYVDPQTQPTRAMAEKVTEGNTAIFRHGKQEKRLTAFSEEKVTNALVNVLKDKTKKIYFTKGHGEGALKGTEANGFNTIATDLEGNKDTVEELSLLEAAKVPDDADMVVIAGPKYDLKEEETRMLEDYLKRGGSLLVMDNAMTPDATLNRFLEKFGIRYQNDLLILDPNDIRAQMIGQNNAIVTDFDEFNPVTKDFARQSQVAVVLRSTRSVQDVPDNPNKLKVTLAAKTAKEVIRVKNVNQPGDLENLTEDRWETGQFPVLAVAAGKTQTPATADAADKGANDKNAKTDAAKDAAAGKTRETRVVAIGSVDFANNQGAQTPEHRDLFMNMTNYLLQDEDFISIRPKDPTKSTLTLTSGRSQLSLVLLSYIYPFVFLGGGTLVWLRRRRA